MSPHSKTTQDKIAACEALGLSYWADHPTSGCMWAVDGRQKAHVVRWYRPNKRTQQHQVALQSQGNTRRVFDVGDAKRPGKGWVDVVPTYDAGDRITFQTA